MAKTSPTQRSLKFLRAAGHTVAITEHWNHFTRRRHDLLGFIDLVALHPGQPGILGVQTTSGTCHSARREKVLGLPSAKLWLETGNRIWILSWSKRGARGKVKKWEPRIEELTLAHFPEERTDG